MVDKNYKKSIKKFIFSKIGIVKTVTPNFFLDIYRNLILINWVKKYVLSPFKTPTYIKQKILFKHSIKNATWIETGTYTGLTTAFLAKRFPCVHTIEPSEDCLKIAKSNLARFNNVNYHFGTSEEKLEGIISQLSGDLCLWLDGHFSGGITFCGDNECPVIYELETISKNRMQFSNLIIFVDDIAASFVDQDHYPDIDFYVDWARKNKFNWFIEQGIFIAKSQNIDIFKS